MKRISSFLITVALIAGMVGCAPAPTQQYHLTISSTGGGSVITPGEGISTYDEGTVVNLVAQADDGYRFVNWTGDVDTIADVEDATTTIIMKGDYSVVADFALEICDWYDLDDIRDNLGGSYILMNDLDSTSAGYEELAGPTADGGKGWEPIGTFQNRFVGTFNGQGYEIRDLFIHRPDEDFVGLFGSVGEGAVVEHVGAVNLVVSGGDGVVGGLVGWSLGTVSNSYSIGIVTGEGGDGAVGGLVGSNNRAGTVHNSYSTASVTGYMHVGGLVGWNSGTISNSYSESTATGEGEVGGLVGDNAGIVNNSYVRGSVTGQFSVGGLVGWNYRGTVYNSHYSCDEVLINGKSIVTIGAVSAEDFGEWLATGQFMNINERLAQEDGYYLIDNVSNFKQLIPFGQDGSLKFKLTNDLDLGSERNFYIPYLAGEFDGNGHSILNLGFDLDFVSQAGLFGYLARGGRVSGLRLESVNIIGSSAVGGLVGWSSGTVSNSCSSGSVTGSCDIGGLVGRNYLGSVSNSYANSIVTGYDCVGGLVGFNDGEGRVSDSYSAGSVTGEGSVGGLVGWMGWVGFNGGSVSNSHYNCDQVLINGRNMITIGALFTEDFQRWLADDKSLDVNGRLSKEGDYYLINNVSDFKHLLALGQDGSLKFRLKNDLDLASEAGFYIPYLAGEFDGNGHQISNISFNFDFVSDVGLFGYLASGGKVTGVGVDNVNMTGYDCVGGLVGGNEGTVSKSYSSGNVTGREQVGGLVGGNGGPVRDSYSTGSVAGDLYVGGLVGCNNGYTVDNSYSTGSVTGDEYAGGLVGLNAGTVSNSFWDMETSGVEEADGGTGMTTMEMKNIATFSGSGWNIIAVANPSTCNSSYIWNIVDGVSYPFLSWQSVS